MAWVKLPVTPEDNSKSPHKSCARRAVTTVVLGTIAVNASGPTARTTPRLTSQVRPCVRSCSDMLPLQLSRYKYRIAAWGDEIVAPPVGSLPLPKWARGPLSLSCRPGTPAYKHETKMKSMTCYHMLPRVPRLRTLPPCWGGLRRCHMSHGSRPRLLAREGSGAATCPMALDTASLLGRTPTLPRDPWLTEGHGLQE
jgi:hypothetical protein